MAKEETAGMRGRVWVAIAIAGVAIGAGGLAAYAKSPSPAMTGTTVTQGEFKPFAAGAHLVISGHAKMVRTADGRTIVWVYLQGLTPGQTYAVHVHNTPCAQDEADGHYKFSRGVPGGAGAGANEIWPGPVTADSTGVADGRTVVGGRAGDTAVSVVLHRPGGPPNKIACADLH
jgi:Cu-Zn family superoxide dismutase